MKVHLSLPVTNIESTQSFYDVLFNSSAVKVKSDYAKYLPEHIPLNISFTKTSRELQLDRHLGIQLDSRQALDAEYERLKKAGIISQAKKDSVCCYARQDKFWVSDPDGYAWELYFLMEDSEVRDDELRSDSCCV
ncbi:ArsI/CadI family heavy metal resistance metalloenzyme [Marinicella sp. W31]|uniref:ArsI/CadI family heavy metal resistance metalloenzyme n=1 Tax=Marinicella sp. W31 TaxID=3023713 RepID=UPI0037582F71